MPMHFDNVFMLIPVLFHDATDYIIMTLRHSVSVTTFFFPLRVCSTYISRNSNSCML